MKISILSPTLVKRSGITVLVDVANGLPTDTLLLFARGEYVTTMQFVSQTGQVRSYSADYVLPVEDVLTTVEFRTCIERYGLNGPLSAPFIVNYTPELLMPRIVNFPEFVAPPVD